jgi:multidrug efflux system outer membrane protein
VRCATSELKRRVALLAAGLLTMLGARVAEAQVVKLAELERQALQTRPSLAAADARLAAARARVDVAASAAYPTLTAGATLDMLPGSWLVNVRDEDGQRYVVQGARALGQDGAFTPQSRYGASLLLSGKVYDFGRTRFLVEAADAARAAEKEGIRVERFQVKSQVQAAYLDWLSAYESRSILERSAQETRELREMLEARIAEGTRPGAELSTARYEEAQARLALAQSEQELADARAELEQASASHLPAAAEPDLAVLEQPQQPQGQADSIGRLKQGELSLRKTAALANARAQRRARAPLLAANLEAGVRGQTSQAFPLYRAGLSLSVPIFDAGLTSASAALAEAQAAELSALANEEQLRIESEQGRRTAELERCQRRLTFAQSLLAAAREELERSRAEAELGNGPREAVAEARRRVAQAELEVLSARVARARVALRLDPAAARP